jgi:RNA polymerase sigma-70 factor (ECF subfamily)
MGGDLAGRTSVSLLGRLHENPGDASAWNDFVRRYSPQINQWCRHWNLQEADAEDVTQNVLLELARKMKTFTYDPSQSFRGWLKTLTHAAWCDFLDSRRRHAQGSGDTVVLQQLREIAARDDLARRLEEEYDRELLELAIFEVRRRVAPATWEAFRLLAFEGLSGAEVAARLGMSVGNVYVARSNVQKMLKECLSSLESGNE